MPEFSLNLAVVYFHQPPHPEERQIGPEMDINIITITDFLRSCYFVSLHAINSNLEVPSNLIYVITSSLSHHSTLISLFIHLAPLHAD